MAVSKRTRYEVLRRDEFTCRYCRSTAGELTVDHVIPVSLGGSDAPDNLVAACRDCNAGKASSAPDASKVDQVGDDALRWSRAMQQAADVLAQRVDEREEYIGAFISNWYRSTPTDSLLGTVGTMYDLGLPKNVMIDAAHTACDTWGINDRKAYFAGICWKRIRAMRDIADQIVQGQD